jgi:hypothetical protein
MEEYSMNKFAKILITAALATLAVTLAQPTTGQEPDAKARKLSVALQARIERKDVALQSLIDAQQKCYDQTTASVLAGQQPRPVECPVLDEMTEQTTLETLIGEDLRGIEGRMSPEDVSKVKHAIVNAAYFGYQRGKWKNMGR